MAKDPDDRYASTVELADAARDAITVPIPRPTPSPAPNPPTAQAGTATAPWVPHDEPPQPPPIRSAPTLTATAEQQDNKIAQQPTQLAPTQTAGAPKTGPPPVITAPSSFWLTGWGWAVILVAALVVIAAVIAIMVFVGESTNIEKIPPSTPATSSLNVTSGLPATSSETRSTTTAAAPTATQVVPGNIPVGSTKLSDLNSAQVGSCMSKGQWQGDEWLLPQPCGSVNVYVPGNFFRVTKRTYDPNDCAASQNRWVQATDTSLVLCLQPLS